MVGDYLLLLTTTIFVARLKILRVNNRQHVTFLLKKTVPFEELNSVSIIYDLKKYKTLLSLKIKKLPNN